MKLFFLWWMKLFFFVVDETVFFVVDETLFGRLKLFLRGWNFFFGWNWFFLWWNCFFGDEASIFEWNTCRSVHISCSSEKLRRASPCRGIHLSALAEYAAPVPEVERISPAAAVSFAAPAPLQYAAPVRHAAPTITETGIDLHQTASQMYSQRPQAGYAAPAQYGAPIQYGGPVVYVPALRSTMTVTEMNMIWTALRMSYSSPTLATELPCSTMLPYNWNNHKLRGTFCNMKVTGVDIYRHGIPTFGSNRRLDLHLKVFAAPVQECSIQPSQPTPGIQLRREPSILAGYGMFLGTCPCFQGAWIRSSLTAKTRACRTFSSLELAS